MSLRKRPVAVLELPERVNARESRALLRQIEQQMSVDRPCIVLDCSRLIRLDRLIGYLLLCSLEEAMKRNGDVKLACVSNHRLSSQELAWLGRLFDVFNTPEEAVNSFHQLPFHAASENTRSLLVPSHA